MWPAAVVVVSTDQLEDGHGELVGERGSIGCGFEADLGVDRERRQPPPGSAGLAREGAHLAGQAAGERDEIPSREVVGNLLRARTVLGDGRR